MEVIFKSFWSGRLMEVIFQSFWSGRLMEVIFKVSGVVD